MVSIPQSSPEVICAENVAFLYSLHPVPRPPSTNSVGSSIRSRKGYQLPFERERALSSVLAFLSNVKDDPDHVPAICIQEDLASSGVIIAIAVNSAGRARDGNALEQSKRSLEAILRPLSLKLGEEYGSTMENAVFDAIIAECSERIKCRLRFVPKKGRPPKQQLKDAFQSGINAVLNLKSIGNLTADLNTTATMFLLRAKKVLQSIEKWSKHQTANKLKEVVENIGYLSELDRLPRLLSSVPSRDWNPSSKLSLINIINKSARYPAAARFLCTMVKRFSLLRSLKVIAISLPQDRRSAPGSIPQEPSLDATMARLNQTVSRTYKLHQICSLLNTTVAYARTAFSQQTKKIVLEAKIHAEIQLLLYYELQNLAKPPRVVCSSKDACFLCNMFIEMYGKMYTPKSHGRLYPAWRLPTLSTRSDIILGFNQTLEKSIESSLIQLVTKPQRINYIWPNESTLLTLPNSLAASAEHIQLGDEAVELDSIQVNDTSLYVTQRIPKSADSMLGTSQALPDQDHGVNVARMTGSGNGVMLTSSPLDSIQKSSCERLGAAEIKRHDEAEQEGIEVEDEENLHFTRSEQQIGKFESKQMPSSPLLKTMSHVVSIQGRNDSDIASESRIVDHVVVLQQGKPSWHEHTSTERRAADRQSRLYTTGAVELYFDFESDSESGVADSGKNLANVNNSINVNTNNDTGIDFRRPNTANVDNDQMKKKASDGATKLESKNMARPNNRSIEVTWLTPQESTEVHQRLRCHSSSDSSSEPLTTNPHSGLARIANKTPPPPPPPPLMINAMSLPLPYANEIHESDKYHHQQQQQQQQQQQTFTLDDTKTFYIMARGQILQISSQ